MKRLFIIVPLLAGIVALLLGWTMFGDHPSFETGLRHMEGLPSAASDITVYRNRNLSGVFLADFKIAEADFILFATEKRWPVQPISGSTLVFHAGAFQSGRPNDKREIADGLYYSHRESNGGGVTVAYDRKNGRAYIESRSR